MAFVRGRISSDYPPKNYTTPPWPSLLWPPQEQTLEGSLYYLSDVWRFTLIWTFVIYALVHLGAAAIALIMQLGKARANWKFLWMIPTVYMVLAGIEALFAGTVVGLMHVSAPPPRLERD